MSIIVVESSCRDLLRAFTVGLHFPRRCPGLVSYSTGPGWVILNMDDEEDNLTYTLTPEGIEFKHTGVEI